MIDLCQRLEGWCEAVEDLRHEPEPVTGLFREASEEIKRLRLELAESVRIMNICIADYGKLRQVALDGDALVAYRLGVRHAQEGDPCLAGSSGSPG